jgi:soluble lytic murein transglycosylase-like protein
LATDLRVLALAAALAFDLDGAVFCRLVGAESDWDVTARTTSSVGLAQVNQAAWNWWPDDPYDPEANLAMGAWVLRWNYAYRFDADNELERWRQAVASYNLGHAAVNRLLAEHGDGWMDALPERVRAYVDAIVTGERARTGEAIAI